MPNKDGPEGTPVSGLVESLLRRPKSGKEPTQGHIPMVLHREGQHQRDVSPIFCPGEKPAQFVAAGQGYGLITNRADPQGPARLQSDDLSATISQMYRIPLIRVGVRRHVMDALARQQFSRHVLQRMSLSPPLLRATVNRFRRSTKLAVLALDLDPLAM